jgi:hypothetical protein
MAGWRSIRPWQPGCGPRTSWRVASPDIRYLLDAARLVKCYGPLSRSQAGRTKVQKSVFDSCCGSLVRSLSCGGKGRYREGSTKVYRANEKRSSSMDMREEIYLLVAGAWRIHVALLDYYLWS